MSMGSGAWAAAVAGLFRVSAASKLDIFTSTCIYLKLSVQGLQLSEIDSAKA